MFVAVYEFHIKEGTENSFKKAWIEVTKSIYKDCGSFGSRLHTSEQQNILVGYAQWPSKEQWEKGHSFTDYLTLESRKIMSDCLIESKTVYKLEVAEDFLKTDQAEVAQ